MSIPCIVTVRTQSSRLPEKCLLSFGETSVIEHIILRLKHFGHRPIICTTLEKEDDRLVQFARRLKISSFRGSTENKLLRWLQCCDHFNLESFHTVDADDPFFCPYEVTRSYKLLIDKKYDMVAPTPSSSAGGATVGYSLKRKIIEKVCDDLDADTDTEMMWSFVERLTCLKSSILPDPETNVIRARMTLDYWEDYIFLESIRLILGNFASRKQIFNLLQNNPDLTLINSFRNREWAKNQKDKSFDHE